MDDFKQPEQNEVPNSDPVSTEPVAYEDSETYVTPQGEPTVATPTPAPLEIVKKKSHAGKWLLWGLVVLLLAGLGAFAYWQYTEVQNAKSETASLKSALETIQNANQANADEKTDTAQLAKELTDQEEVVIVAKEFTAVRSNNQFTALDEKDVVLNTSKQFAKATLGVGTSTEGGYTVIAKKLKDTWVVVYGGVDMTTEQKNNLGKEFGVPESLLADS